MSRIFFQNLCPKYSIKSVGVSLALVLMSFIVTLQSTHASSNVERVAANREYVIANIITNVSTMAHQRAYLNWRDELAASLRLASNTTLASIEFTNDYDDVTRALRNYLPEENILNELNLTFEDVIGDPDRDLVYTPLTPCRVVDTRFGGGGILLTRQTRSFSVNGNTSSQGGVAACGVPDGATEPPAVVLNITSALSTSAGFVTVWPAGTGRPNASILNFSSGQNIANSGIITTSVIAGTNEVSVFVSAPTHIIIDVMGYFNAP